MLAEHVCLPQDWRGIFHRVRATLHSAISPMLEIQIYPGCISVDLLALRNAKPGL